MNEKQLVKGTRYRITRPIGGLTVGTEFTYAGTKPYLDWYQCLIVVNGVTKGIGLGLPDYCEAVAGARRSS